MDQRIREYADAMYVKALSEASNSLEQEIVATKRKMAQRGMASSGIAYSEMIRIHAAYIGKQMMARFTTYRNAFEQASATPSGEDVQHIWDAVRGVYEQGLRSIASRLRDYSKRRGDSLDPSGSLESAVAHHHDRALNEWKVWRAQVGLGAPPQKPFAIDKLPTVNEMPQKDDLLHDLDRLMQTHAQGVLFIDLDNFKAVNDTMGHDEGDKCLEHVAQIIGSVVLHKGRVYRYASGDEFMVVLPNCDEMESTATAERIRKAIDFENPGGSVKVTASIGVIVATGNSYKSAEEVLKAVDRTMYKAKLKRNALSIG
jgi:diguanylate cyclase (GGDEF)-like protein